MVGLLGWISTTFAGREIWKVEPIEFRCSSGYRFRNFYSKSRFAFIYRLDQNE